MLPKGFKHSAETIQKMRDWNASRPPATAETKLRMSESAKRKAPVSDETRARMAEGQKRRREQLRAEDFCEKNNLPLEEYLKEIAAGNEWCTKCHQFRRADQFESRRHTCMVCIYAKNESWYRRNREAIRERMRRRYAENTDGVRDKNKAWSLRKYGATMHWYDETLAAQGAGCAICGTNNPNSGAKHFAIDHNHACCSARKTACDKCRRGLLCSDCNHALERIESISDWPERARAYLQRYACLSVSNSSEKYPSPASGPCGRWRSSGKYPVGKKTSSESFGRRQ